MPATPPLLADFGTIPPVPCPCGLAQRAFMEPGNTACSLHRVTISENARTHYHRRHTEVYHFLEGRGHIELDGQLHPASAGLSVLIPPHVRHRAVVAPGDTMVLLNFVTPPFDENDEWFDEQEV